MRLVLMCALAGALFAAPGYAALDLEPMAAMVPIVAPGTLAFAYRGKHSFAELSSSVLVAMDQGQDAIVPTEWSDDWEPTLAPEWAASRELSRPALCHAIASAATAHGLPVSFLVNLIHQESLFRSDAISRVGAQGIAQFMPRTAQAYGLYNPFDPVHALLVSGQFLGELRAQFGNLGLAAAAYNAGPGRVRGWVKRGGQLPRETQLYVQKITGRPVTQWRTISSTQTITLPGKAECPEQLEEHILVVAQNSSRPAVSARNEHRPTQASSSRRRGKRKGGA